MKQKLSVYNTDNETMGSIQRHAKVKLDHKYVFMLSRLRDS